MVVSITVFLTIFFVSLFLAKIPACANNGRIPTRHINSLFALYVPIIFASLLIGLRYNVGTDWMAYKTIFEDTPNIFDKAIESSSTEVGFTILNYLIKVLGLDYYWLFIVCTFISLWLYYKSFQDFKWLLPYGIYTLYTFNTIYLFLNIMRQGFAFFILLYGIRYLRERKLLKYLIFVALATSVHSSSLLFLPLIIFAFYRKPILSVSGSLIVYMASWIFGSLIFPYLLNISMLFMDDFYSSYLKLIENMEMEEGSGLGMLMMHICDLAIIIFSKKNFGQFKVYGYDIYYNIFLIGIIFSNIAGMNMLLARLPLCMFSMRLVLGAFLLYSAFREWGRLGIVRKSSALLFVVCSFAFFLANISSFEYSFIFEH